jgi:5-methylcytosine-specific restriction protein A
MPRLKTIGPRVGYLANRVAPPPRWRDPFYNSADFKRWRAVIVVRAGYRCEHVDRSGHRCTREAPEHRLFAHHIKEIKDQGDPLDVRNGRCLCYQHHEQASAAARMQRLR